WTTAAAGAARARNLRGNHAPRQAFVLTCEFVSAQYCRGAGKQLALPRRLALPVYMRGWPRSLLLAAARLSRHPARGVHGRAAPSRVLHEKIVRPALHRLLRSS